MVQKKRKATLNVKDPEAHRLAQAIAEETGGTLTRVVTEALRERYQHLHKGDPETLAAEIRCNRRPRGRSHEEALSRPRRISL